MYVAFVGSREYPRLDLVRAHVAALAQKYPDAIVVSGGCRGVDLAAEGEAEARGLRIVSYRPAKSNHAVGQWRCDRHEFDPAGYGWVKVIGGDELWSSFRDVAFGRNAFIAERADVVMAYPCRASNGSLGGTGNTIRHAERLQKALHVYELPNPLK